MYQAAGKYIVSSCKCINKVLRTNFLKQLGKLTEHSRAGDAFSCFSADCVEQLDSAEYRTHPVSTNCLHHLNIIISGRLPVIWIVLTHNTMYGMKQILHVFRQNTNPRAYLCRHSHRDLATKHQPLVAQNVVLLELLERPISSPHCWLHGPLNQALSS